MEMLLTLVCVALPWWGFLLSQVLFTDDRPVEGPTHILAVWLCLVPAALVITPVLWMCILFEVMCVHGYFGSMISEADWPSRLVQPVKRFARNVARADHGASRLPGEIIYAPGYLLSYFVKS